MAVLWVVCAAGQTNYSFTNCRTANSTYNDISGTGTAITMTNPQTGNSTTAQNIGFNFTFNGTVFTQFMIHADGVLRFGTAAPGAATSIATNPGLTYGGVFTSAVAAYQNIIMPFFCDLVQGLAAPQFHVQVTGTTPNQVCTIQWKNLRDADNSGSSLQHQFENLEFQVKLFETSNDIEFVYGAFTPSANTPAGRFAATGIKAGSTSFIYYFKPLGGSSYTAVEFLNPAGHVNLGARFVFRNNNIPPSGHILRFFGTITDDINTAELYADQFIPKNGTVTKNIKARIKNEGTNAAANIPVTLTVSGANNFTETINIVSLAAGADQVVTFTPFSVPNTGDQTVNVSVTPVTDGRTANNGKEVVQKVTNGLLQTHAFDRRTFGGVGFTSATGMMSVKMHGQGTRKITQIRLPFTTLLVPVDVRIHEDNGTSNTPGPVALFTTAEFKTGVDNEFIIPVDPGITVTDDYYIVIAQRNTTNMGAEYVTEYPINPQKHYTTTLNGTTWSEQSADRGWHTMVRVFEETGGTDVGIQSLSSPSCNYSQNEDVIFTIRNFTNTVHDYATNPVTITGFVKDVVNNLTTPFSVIKNTGSIAAGGSDAVTVLTGYNFNPRGYHQFNAKTVCTGDAEAENDSLNFYIYNKVNITKTPADSTCPYSSTTLAASTTYLSGHGWYLDRNLTQLFSAGSAVAVNVIRNDSIFYVRATDYRNCQLVDSVIVHVKKDVPVAPVITSADTVMSHRNGFLVTLNVPPLGGHTINWFGGGTPLNGGESYEVKGILASDPFVHSSSYTIAGGCGGIRDTMLTRYSVGVLMNNTDPLIVCDSSIYDMGGPAGNYGSSSYFIRTFTPATAGTKMKFTVYNLSLGTSSRLQVFDGPDLNAPILISLNSSQNGSTVRSFTASNTTGVLTILMEGNGTAGAGFLGGLTCQEPLQFRTISNGVYTNAAIWESRSIGGSYTAATRIPVKGDDIVLIQHSVTVSTTIGMDQTIVEAGGNLQVNAGGNIDISKTIPGTELIINGTLTNNSSITNVNAAKGKILVNGTLIQNGSDIEADSVIMAGIGSPSVLSGNGEIYSLKINSTTGVILNGNPLVSIHLDLQQGIVTVNPANYLRMDPLTSLSGGHAGSYIDGKLRRRSYIRDVTDTLLFPLGDNGIYRRMGLTVTQTSFDSYVEYEGELKSGAPPARTLPGSLTNVNSNWYHTVTIVGGASFFTSARMTIHYESSDAVLNASVLRVAKDDGGSNWLDIGGTGTANGTGSITSNNFSSFSDFVLANLNLSSLPVTWLSFEVNKQGQHAILHWRTAQESNCTHYEIERSRDGIHFDGIHITACNNISSISNYYYTDAGLTNGRWFYRIRQVDVDGRYNYSKVVSITIADDMDLLVWPNPVGDELNIKGAAMNSMLQLYTTDGKLVWQQRITSVITVIDMRKYQAGVYLLRYDGETGVVNRKIVKQ